MSKSIRVLSMGVVEAILAAVVVIMIGYFSMQAMMEELSTNQQLSNFYKFRSQVASVCERVKVTPNELIIGGKEYLVLYPFYDIRFYNQTGDMPTQVASVCRGDKCACLVKVTELDAYDQFFCAFSSNKVDCWYGYAKLEGVLSCFNMQEMGCNNQIWFAKDLQIPIREYKVGLSNTCKVMGVITWDRTDFAYDKLSEYCFDPSTQEVVIDVPEGYCDTGCL